MHDAADEFLGELQHLSDLEQLMNIPIKTTAFELGYGQTHSEDLGISPAQIQEFKPGYVNEGFYQLNFEVQNILPSYPGYFEVEIDFGTQELGSADGWGVKAATQCAFTWPSPGYIVVDKELPNGGPVQGAQNLVLKFTVPGWQLQFNNVSLTFTPQ